MFYKQQVEHVNLLIKNLIKAYLIATVISVWVGYVVIVAFLAWLQSTFFIIKNSIVGSGGAGGGGN